MQPSILRNDNENFHKLHSEQFISAIKHDSVVSICENKHNLSTKELKIRIFFMVMIP